MGYRSVACQSQRYDILLSFTGTPIENTLKDEKKKTENNTVESNRIFFQYLCCIKTLKTSAVHLKNHKLPLNLYILHSTFFPKIKTTQSNNKPT